MDDNESVTVDFVLPVESEAAEHNSLDSALHLGKCSCGAETFILANEMEADAAKGVPASRMYECTACGAYRLG